MAAVNTSPVTIAVISDFHYAARPNPNFPERKGECAPVLLAGVIRKLNREIRPDLLIVAGDLIHDPKSGDAERLTLQIAEILKSSEAPQLVLRGNHDVPAVAFEKIFPFRRITDVGNIRIVAFDDPEAPGSNAVRPDRDVRIMRQAADGWAGALISLQHMPLIPPGRWAYGYANADELIGVMKECGYSGAVSAHFHDGIPIDDNEPGPLRFHVQSALCEAPYACTLIGIGADGVMRTAGRFSASGTLNV